MSFPISDSSEIFQQDEFNLRINSKKLRSGKCQVKFYATVKDKKDLYGYVLVDSKRTLKEVVHQITNKLNAIHYTTDFHHIHLYSIGKTNQDDLNMIIFDS